jgi:uncharacterized cupredoxin-like copper-binding protein
MTGKNFRALVAMTTIVTLTTFGTAYADALHKTEPGTSDVEDMGHGHAKTVAFGEPGGSSEVSREIEVTMMDNYFEPETINIRAGETVRFVIKNYGDFLHEFNIGTTAMHAAHQEEMMTMMEHGMLTATAIDEDMMSMNHSDGGMSGHVHDDPNSVLLEPGETKELIWKFVEATDLELACNVPGHYDAGMTGTIEFSM